MEFSFVDNNKVKLSNILDKMFLSSRQVKVAVAFAKYSGVQLIESSLNKCLDKGGRVEFIVGLDFRTTDARSLRTLSAISKIKPAFNIFCYSDPSDNTSAYHPKLYLFETETLLKSIIGSSNLTLGGLLENIEVNVVLELERDCENAENLRDIYANIKYQPSRFVPDDQYIDAYQEVLDRVSHPKNTKTDTQKAVEYLRRLEATLPKPYINPSELSGWQKLVFAKLPEGEFGTNELYKYASDFQQTYPDNKNIEPKIRQVLQQLRDLGLIIHVNEGRWRLRI